MEANKNGRWILANVTCQQFLRGNFVTVQQEVHSISDQASRTETSLKIAHLEVNYGKDAHYVNDIFNYLSA